MQNFLGKDFLKNIIEEFPEAVILCTNNIVIFANKRFLEISNHSSEELQSFKKEKLIKITEDVTVKSLNETNTNNIYQAEIKAKDGSTIPARIKIKFIGNISIYCIVPLQEMACLNQAHLDFVSTVSHELRTPLTSIKGFADTILISEKQLSSEQKTRFITIIRDQVNRLTRLVEELLTVSRLEAKKDSSVIKELDFVQFIEPILHSIKQKEPDHQFKVKITDKLPKIFTDKDKLEQIMTNLLDNAAKYSNKGSTVSLKVDFKHNNNEIIEIKVSDEGVGIPEQYLSKIFTKFSRIDNPLTRQVQGTGLGLYITKTLVERLNGKIFVQSNDKGSTFIIEMPVTTPEMQVQEKFIEQVNE